MAKPLCTHWAQAPDNKCDTLEHQLGITWQQLYSYNDDIDEKCSNLVKGLTVRVFML
jgi:hypothetical protein